MGTGEFAREPKEKLFQKSCFLKSEDSAVNYLRCAPYNPVVSGASDFGIILRMRQFIVCLNKRSTGFKLHIR